MQINGIEIIRRTVNEFRFKCDKKLLAIFADWIRAMKSISIKVIEVNNFSTIYELWKKPFFKTILINDKKNRSMFFRVFFSWFACKLMMYCQCQLLNNKLQHYLGNRIHEINGLSSKRYTLSNFQNLEEIHVSLFCNINDIEAENLQYLELNS